jgi:death-on-curing protein
MLSVCINKPYYGFGNQEIYPHVLHKASVIIHSISNYHPFVDGNKRVTLLCAYSYLFTNGYKFDIPYNADDFMIKIVTNNIGYNDILKWLVENTSKTPYTILYNLQGRLLVSFCSKPLLYIFNTMLLLKQKMSKTTTYN